MQKIAVTTAIALLSATALAGCSSSSSAGSDTPIKIGIVSPISGDLALDAKEMNRGYQLAVDTVNKDGGIKGRKVEIVFADANTPEQGASAAQRLATRENVDIMGGTLISAVSDTASQTAQRYNKLFWETNALAKTLTERKLNNYIRVGMNAANFGDYAAAVLPLIAKQLNKPVADLKVYIEHEKSIYGTSIADLQEAAVKKAGATVLGNAAHDSAASDLTASVLKAKKAKPDIVMFTGYNEGILYLRTAKAQNFRPPAYLFSGAGDAASVKEGVGAQNLNGILVAGYPRDLNPTFGPGSAAFESAFKKKYGHVPELPQAMTAYTGLTVLFDVLKKSSGLSPASVKKAAASFDLPLGSLPNGWGVKFDSTFQNTRTRPGLVQWQNGVVKTVFPADALPDGNKLEPLKPE